MAFGVGQSLSGATRGKSQIHANASYRVVVVHEVLLPTYSEITSSIAPRLQEIVGARRQVVQQLRRWTGLKRHRIGERLLLFYGERALRALEPGRIQCNHAI